MIWFIIFIAFVIIILLVANAGETNTEPDSLSHAVNNTFEAGTYRGGHPNADKEIATTYVFIGEDKLSFNNSKLSTIKNGVPILYSDIKNVLLEDAATFESKVTLGRVLLVGIFALAWKKKKKIDGAFLTIEWESAGFTHNTIFQFEGSGAMEKANTLRNKIIAKITHFRNAQTTP